MVQIDLNRQAKPLSVVTKTANYTLTTQDNVVLGDTTTAGFTLTLPSSSAGKLYTIKNIGTHQLTVSGPIDGDTSVILTTQYTSVDLIGNGTTWELT